MKEFIRILQRFVPPYKSNMVWNIVFNVLSAILNLFSFALIIPILQILFKINEAASLILEIQTCFTLRKWNDFV